MGYNVQDIGLSTDPILESPDDDYWQAFHGIKVTIIEPAGYATDWGGPSAQRATPNPAYDGARAAVARMRGNNPPGDPEATGPAILKVVDAPEPPLRVFFGTVGLPMTRAEYARRLETWEKWSAVANEAQGNLPHKPPQ